MKTGRPTLLTKEVQATIVGAILVGATKEVAARSAGIAPRTLRDWIARGLKAEDVDELPADEQPYLDFIEAVERARAEYEVTLLRDLATSEVGGGFEVVRPDAKARQWLLERTRPERYALRVEVIAREQAARVVLERLRTRLSEDAFEQVAHALADETWDGAEEG